MVAVERNRRAAAVARDNARAVGADVGGWSLTVGDVTRMVEELGPFDGVVADPPYVEDPDRWLARLAPVAARWLVLEVDARRVAPAETDSGGRLTVRRFGSTALWVVRSA